MTRTPEIPYRQPFVLPVGTGFVPVVYHPSRETPYLRLERFPRKAKASSEEALAYAARVIWYRQRRENEKRRRREAIEDPRYHQETGRAA
jgi:hypothetical protein